MRTERYDFLHLPEKYHSAHKKCEFLLQQIEDFISRKEYQDVNTHTIHFEEEPVLIEGENILDYLNRKGLFSDLEVFLKKAVLQGMVTDSVHFLQLALHASLQRRLTVTFALIRKPFCYNLLVILRAFLTSDFLNSLMKLRTSIQPNLLTRIKSNF